VYSRDQILEMVHKNERLFDQPFEFPHGLRVESSLDARERLRRIGFPNAFQDGSVLAVGSNLGFYLHEARARGAGRLVAIEADPERLALCREIDQNVFGSGIELHALRYPEGDARLGSERFDYGLLIGGLHELSHPYRVLERLARRITRLLIVEAVVSGERGTHAFALRDRHRDLVPSEDCLAYMLRSLFPRVERVGNSIGPGDDSLRVVYHALP